MHFISISLSLSFVIILQSQEIQKRCEAIVKMVEKEIDDIRKLEEEEMAAENGEEAQPIVAQVGTATHESLSN